MGNQYQSEGRGPHEGGTVMIVRLSADEKRRIQRDAKGAGLSMSQHVRARLGLEPPPAPKPAPKSRARRKAPRAL